MTCGDKIIFVLLQREIYAIIKNEGYGSKNSGEWF